VLGTEVLAMLIAAFGWLMPAISWSAIGLIVAYTLGWMIIWDLGKTRIHHVLDHGLPRYRRLVRLIRTDLRDVGTP
jgi:H+-transporting ATPase